jgi:probable DNA metabolism protein
MSFCLEELFAVICNNDLPCAKREEDLFGFVQETVLERRYVQADIDLLSNYFSRGFDIAALSENAQKIFELSANVFELILHAWMSEFPIETEIAAFGRRALAAAQDCGSREKRSAAEDAALDRGDESSRIVLASASKTQFEAHRMMGLLRFSPDSNGTYIALCEPDHLILPSLGEYFTSRFGETPWAIIDIKRGLCLNRRLGEKAKLAVMKTAADISVLGDDEWEELWRHYHRIINNESRKNLHLQRQLMPKRYWKYLPEM